MKKTKIIYWIATGIFAGIFGTNGTLYLLNAKIMADKFQWLGYPHYVMTIIGVAKIIGAFFLLLPRYPRLKEWVYAGFVINLIGAAWSHAEVDGILWSIRLLLPTSILTVSYICYRKLQIAASGAKNVLV